MTAQTIRTTENGTEPLQSICKAIRHWILSSTHSAGSGHPTSALSAVELMATLFFDGHLRFDVDQPNFPGNDRVIFSKGHASPLLYALWVAADQVPAEQLQDYRSINSTLEGHPTSHFRFAEAATGSLGQGLSIGLGMALAAKHVDELSYRTYVLLGDSEMSEGSQWEAMQLAAHYQLNNLMGILDVNRLGQRGETMVGQDLSLYARRVEAFGWQPILVEDGHDLAQVTTAYRQAAEVADRPVMLIARTVKGKGISFLADQPGWHGKALDDEQFTKAKDELGEADLDQRATIAKPDPQLSSEPAAGDCDPPEYELGQEVATRDGYGKALRRIGAKYPNLVALDGEVSNSTRAKFFAEAYPERFFEMFVAEQNMVGAGIGLALCGKMPFVSTFAAFLSRAFDQIRMAPHCDANVKFVGSHAGVSIGQDGPSQMGLEDIAMFRTIPDSVVVYPCDAVSTEHLVEELATHRGVAYLRATRGKTPVIYDVDESFPLGGSKVLHENDQDVLTVATAGITVHEALKAYEQLKEQGMRIRVIDLYSVKPLDSETLRLAAQQTTAILTVEDHYAPGGIGEAVRSELATAATPVISLAVHGRPRSGKPEELLERHQIDATAIVKAVTQCIQQGKGTLADSVG